MSKFQTARPPFHLPRNNILTTQQGTFCADSARGACGMCSSRLLWTILDEALQRAIATEQPAVPLDLLDSYQWPRLWQDNELDFPCIDVKFLYTTFMPLHKCASRVLQFSPDNAKAKTFLREQLGSCHYLLRNVLRHIIAGFKANDDDSSAPIRLRRIFYVCQFFYSLPCASTRKPRNICTYASCADCVNNVPSATGTS
jgi:hypothetical protein